VATRRTPAQARGQQRRRSGGRRAPRRRRERSGAGRPRLHARDADQRRARQPRRPMSA
jgi:hypothetical protein